MRTPLPIHDLKASVKHLLLKQAASHERSMAAEAPEILTRAVRQNTAHPLGAQAQVSEAARNALASVDLMPDLRGGD